MHERLINRALQELRTRGATLIRADHVPGFRQPDEINGFIPDVTAVLNGQALILEAETLEGLESKDHTVRQWTAFSREAQLVTGRLIIVIEKSHIGRARYLLKQIAGDTSQVVFWTI